MGLARKTGTAAYNETEKGFQQAVMKTARLYRWLAYHPFDSRRSEPGFPDLVMARPRSPVLFIELKREGEELSDEQWAWLNALWASSGRIEAGVWRPSNWDHLVQTLQRGER